MDTNTTIVSGQMLFREADHLLEVGCHELERAEEDVVTPMVCFNSRQSTLNYLRGFLLLNGITPVLPLTLDHLHKQCMRVHPSFEQLDFHSFDCRHEDDDESYCMEVPKVEECLKTALLVQRMVAAIR